MSSSTGSRLTKVHLSALLGALLVGALLGGCGTDYPEAQPPAPSAVQPGSVTRLTVPVAGEQRCMAATSEFLDGQADVAVDATVEDVTGDEVVLVPTYWYRGEPTEFLTLTGPSEAMRGLLPGVRFTKGQRYLVAASGGTTMICGFSGPWSTALERLYADAFGR